MKSAWIAVLAGLVGLGMGNSGAAEATDGPTAFVASVYAACAASETFSTLGADAGRYYAPETLAVMGDYARVTPPGEVGVLGADPVCGYRAYGDVTPRSKAETVTGDRAAVAFYLDSGEGHGPSYNLDLVQVDGHWRIADIAPDLSTGLLQLFADATQPTPEAFLKALYAHYADGDIGWRFTPLNENAAAYFDPEMVALMTEDQRLNEGEIGALDANPICNCQDYNRITADISMLEATDATARVAVHMRDSYTSGVFERAFTYELVRLKGFWRIHDIHSEDVPSLRDLFIASNK